MEGSEVAQSTPTEANGAVVVGTGTSLPEGCSMMVGDDGEQYVTMVQNGQTFAILASDYQTMQEEAGTNGILAIQESIESVQNQAQVILQTQVQPQTEEEVDPQPQPSQPSTPQQQQLKLVSKSKPPLPANLQPVPGPPPGMVVKMKPPAVTTPSPSPARTLFTSHQAALKPIKVDNWGIFLLSRLQTYFQQKEHCDLTLRFPAKNAQIKVHKLVINSCTDFFLKKEKEGAVVDGNLDMDDDFLPEMVAPIIRFMYSGKLEVRPSVAGQLRDTAERLNMSILLKLIDVQLSSPQVSPGRKPRKRVKAEDPLKQMKKIQRIEKKVQLQEKRAKMREKMAEKRREQEEAELGDDLVPGKKLPIWKRRSNQPDQPQTPVSRTSVIPKPSLSPSVKSRLVPVANPPPGVKLVPVSSPPAGLVPIKGPPPPGAFISPLGGKVTPSPRSYKRTSIGEKPKIPKQIREIQENLNFEKIRRTGTKNRNPVQTPEGSKEEMSVEELKEFMEEHRKRLQMNEGDDDDYQDDDTNHAAFDYANEDDEETDDTYNCTPSNGTPVAPSPAKPILKTETPATPGTDEKATPTRKSVRFSLRASDTSGPHDSAIQTPKDIDASSESASPPKKRGRPSKMSSNNLDNTLDEFDKAMESEDERQGTRPGVRKRSEESLETTPKTPPAKRLKRETSSDHTTPSLVFENTAMTDQNQIVQEVLKKYPNLFQHQSQVKLKVQVKDASGHATTQIITLKAGESQADDDSSLQVGMRETPKVKYTGKRGRPKKLQPGERDPHEEVRRSIDNKLRGTVTTDNDAAQASEQASDSLAIAVPTLIADPTQVVISDPTTLASLGNQAVFINYSETVGQPTSMQILEDGTAVIVAPSETQTVVFDDVPKATNVEEAMAKLHDTPAKEDSKANSKPQDVSNLAMEWEEEDE